MDGSDAVHDDAVSDESVSGPTEVTSHECIVDAVGTPSNRDNGVRDHGRHLNSSRQESSRSARSMMPFQMRLTLGSWMAGPSRWTVPSPGMTR